VPPDFGVKLGHAGFHNSQFRAVAGDLLIGVTDDLEGFRCQIILLFLEAVDLVSDVIDLRITGIALGSVLHPFVVEGGKLRLQMSEGGLQLA
jgi:hypothetical protein